MISYRQWRAIGRFLVVGILLWKAATLLFAAVGTKILPLELAFTIWRDPQYKDFGFYLPYLVSIWGNFDGFFYLAIARDGYLAGQQPFFPLYPFIIRLVSLRFGLPYVLSAQIISLMAFVGALIVVARLLAYDRKLALFPLMIAVVLTFPTSYSYGATYNDALFFFLATVTLYLGRTRRFGLAGVAGAAATLTRLNGLALFPFLLIEHGLPIRPRRIWAALLIPLAFAGYALWVDEQFGSWQTLFSAMSVWGQDKVTLPMQVVWRYIKIILFHPMATLKYWVAIVELGSVALYLWALLWSIRKIRLSYWIFFAVSILIPSLTGTFQGMPRYGLHLYPLFLVLAMTVSGQSRLGKAIYFLVALALLVFCVVLFTRGYFIA